ncbi:hypothetical protein FAM14222_002002 [Propionibacterium freudenreichii]|uniref:hypothetical protein n=1 Tax=Propionibacterium freudenreichii TaxID=1744 RepID=UPI0025515C0B|nr:hypothetical protein [Propionibacterium freudenreichii]MDK9593615.1 hypothetical protein [Propionibacterium freudenreichii]
MAPADAFKGDATPNSLEPESADPLPGIVSVAPTQVGDTVTPPPQAGGEHQADGQATTDTHIVKPETPPISGESYVVPEVQGISYQVDGKDVTGVQSVARGTSVNITAVAKPGFVLDKDVQSSWKYVNYFPANPVKPSRTENTITIPVSDGVSYQVDDATVTGTLTVPQDKPLTVKATTAEGYAFPKKATTSWDFTYTATAKTSRAHPLWRHHHHSGHDGRGLPGWRRSCQGHGFSREGPSGHRDRTARGWLPSRGWGDADLDDAAHNK